MKDKEYNDSMNCKYFEKREICESFKQIEQLNEKTLFKSVYSENGYYDDINEEKIDGEKLKN